MDGGFDYEIIDLSGYPDDKKQVWLGKMKFIGRFPLIDLSVKGWF